MRTIVGVVSDGYDHNDSVVCLSIGLRVLGRCRSELVLLPEGASVRLSCAHLRLRLCLTRRKNRHGLALTCLRNHRLNVPAETIPRTRFGDAPPASLCRRLVPRGGGELGPWHCLISPPRRRGWT